MKAFHFLKDQPKFAQLQDPLPSDSEKKKPAAKSIPRPIGRGSAKKMKAVETIVESLKDSMSTTTHPPTSLQTTKALGNLSSDIAELKEGLKKANDTMESLVRHQIMMMAPSPLKSQYFNDVFINISQAESTKKLKLDLERRKLKNETQSILVQEPSNEKKDDSTNQMFMTPQAKPHSSERNEGCCWNEGCLFIGMPGPNLDECGRLDCVSGEKFHHACMVNWVEQRDPNPECLKLCRDCCIKKYVN
jgi:hypothetical protein